MLVCHWTKLLILSSHWSSLGKLSSSLQINFMVDLEWLMMNYEVTRTKDRPLVILYGAENPELASPDLQVTHIRFSLVNNVNTRL